LVVDAYGPTVPIGGGAWSGKDLNKVDRLGGYLARHLAVQAVADLHVREAIVTLLTGAPPRFATAACGRVFKTRLAPVRSQPARPRGREGLARGVHRHRGAPEGTATQTPLFCNLSNWVPRINWI
jgi:hypothetical protein